MSALSDFLERHDMTAGRIATAAVAAMMTVMTVGISPAKAEMPTFDVGPQNVEVIKQSAERINQQMSDVQIIKNAIEEVSRQLTATKKAKLKTSNDAIAKAAADDPNPQIAVYDSYLMKVAAELPEGSQTAELVEHLNWQKLQLVQANRYLDAMKDSFVNGTKADRELAAQNLKDLLDNYADQAVTISFNQTAENGADNVYKVSLDDLAREMTAAAPSYR
jgi:xanthine/CO dehydrogenase XdhC/CoxF family maturation factor|nr:hypothetical protein [Neorhizobium tomejilense]